MQGSGEDVQLTGGTWVYNQPTQATDHFSTTDPVPGVPGGFLPQEKVQSITQSCQWLRKQPTVTIHQLSKLLGRITAAAPTVLSAPPYSTREDAITQATEVIRLAGDPGRGDSGGTAVVVSQSN